MPNIKISKSFIKISQAAKFLGVSPDTLRNWEKQGRLVPERTVGGDRRYSLKVLEQLKKELRPTKDIKRGMLSISKAAWHLGVSPDTLRNWEKRGLLTSNRTEGGARRFSKFDLNKLREELEVDHRFKEFKEELNHPEEVKVDVPQVKFINLPQVEVRSSNNRFFIVRYISRISIVSILAIVFVALVLSLDIPSKFADQRSRADLEGEIYSLATNVEKLQNQLYDFSQQAINTPNPIKLLDPKLSKDKNSDQNVLAETTSDQFLEINADTVINGTITASNVLYGLTAGENVTITEGQRPTISATLTSNDTLQTVTSRGAITSNKVSLLGGAVLGSSLTTASLTADPSSASNGDIYYNTTSNIFRCYKNGSWTNCDTDTTSSGDIEAVNVGNGLTGGGSSGSVTIDLDVTTTSTTTTTSANSGLEIASSGLSLLRGCTNNQVLSWDATDETWECSSAGGLGGSGTAGTIAKFSSSNTLADSLISESGTTISLSTATALTASSLATLTTSSSLSLSGPSTITTDQTSLTLFNTNATTVNFAGAATTALNIGNGNGNFTAINLGSGSGTHTINIAGTGATAADTINIGTGGTTADTINIGNSASTTALNFTSGTGSQTHSSSVATGTTTSSAFVFNASSLSSGTGLYVTSSATSGKLLDLNASQTSGTIFNLAYGSSTTLGGALTGLLVDLNSGNLDATNQNLTGVNFKIPTVTNTHTSGTKTLRGALINFGSGSGINQNGAGGTLEYIAADLQLPALTQTAGTLNAYGAKITTPSTITTGGTAYGVNIAATGVGAGTLYGVSVDNITAGAGTEYALNVAGTGWDAVLRVGSTSVINGSGVTQIAGGGTNITTYTTGDILYASATNTLSKLAIGASDGYVLKVQSGVPVWGTVSGSSCATCVITDPSADQIIAPTGQGTTGLIIRQTSTASPTDDIFAVTSSDGATKYLYVDKDGNVNPSSTIGNTLTLTPASDTTALTLVGTNVSSQALQYFNSKNASATSGILNLAYGAAQTLTGTVIGIRQDLSTNVTATNQSVTGQSITLPGVTNTITSGTKAYTGITVTGGSINQNGAGGTTNFIGGDFTIPALTQTAGTLNGYGVQVTTPSSITTAGTAYGLYVNASGVGAGTLYGANIGGITAGAGTEFGLNIGTGWDRDINFASTGAKVAFGDGGTLTFVDSAGNTMCTLSDGGSTGTFSCGSSGTQGYWSRSSTTLSPATANDVVSVTSNVTSSPVLNLSTSGAFTGTGTSSVVSLVADSATTGDILNISGTALTTGSQIVLTGPSSGTAGVTDAAIKLSSDVGNIGTSNGLISSTATIDSTASLANGINLYLSTTNSNGTNANTAYGIYNTFADAIALANTNYGVYSLVNNSGALNAAATKTIYGSYLDSRGTGATTHASVATNVYGQYITTNASHASDNGTVNQYGLYIANGTSSTNGTSTKYGLYLESPTGADTNYAAIFAGGNVGIGDTSPSSSLEIGDGTDSIQFSSVGDITFVDANGGASIAGPAGGDLSITTSDVNFTATGGSAGDADVDVDGYLQADGTIDANGALLLGDGGDALTIDSSTLDITAGAISGATGITSSGTITFSGITGCEGLGTNGSGVLGCVTQTVRKSASEIVNNSNTLQDDDHLVLAIGANETWVFDLFLSYTSNTTPDIKVGFSIPTGATLRWGAIASAAGSSCASTRSDSIITTSDGTVTFGGGGTGTPCTLILHGTIVNSSTGGNLQFRWAQSTADLSDTTVQANSYLTGHNLSNGADLAEVYYSKESIEAGEVVSIDPSLPEVGVRRSDSSYQRSLLGIVSTDPGLTLGDTTITDEATLPVKVALSGRVPVKVSTENGPIQTGDYLTSSSIPGVAMKATKAGPVIGIALGQFNDSQVGSVITFVSRESYNPNNLLDSLSLDKDGLLLIPVAKSDKLVISSELVVEGSLIVGGTSIDSSKLLAVGSLVNDISKLENQNTLLASKIEGLESRVKSQEDKQSQDSKELEKIRELSQNAVDQTTSLDEKIASTSSSLANLSNQINSLLTEIGLTEDSTDSANIAAKITDPNELIATDSASLANLDPEKVRSTFEVSNGVVSDSFKVLGESTLANTNIAGDLIVDGTFSISQNTINALPVLNIQSSSLAEAVKFFNGLVNIDRTGTIVAQKVETKEVRVAEIKLIANKTSGSGVIKAKSKNVEIPNALVSQNSRILITSTSEDAILAVTNKEEGKKFIVSTALSSDRDITFDWLIINEVN